MNNTRIERDFCFQTGLHFEDKFHIGVYDITMSMLVETESIKEQNIAMERIIYFLHEVMQNSVLVSTSKQDVIRQYQNVDLRVCELPEEPYDQILAMVLLLKLNSIAEDRLKITDLVIGSSLSDGVRFNIVSEVAESAFSGKHWWNSPCVAMNSRDFEICDQSKVIKLFTDDWVNLGLSWRDMAKN
jgi:hypothetical protein